MGYPDLVATVWFSLSGPAGLPPEVVSGSTKRRRALELPETRERVKHDGILPNRLDAKAFSAFVADELRRWARSCGPPEQKMIEGVTYTQPARQGITSTKGCGFDLTVGEALRRTAARVPERIAFASEEGELSFQQLDERSERLGAALLDLGARPGERAMFQMGTVLETVVALSACYKAGIIPVCSVPQYREVEIGQLARLSGATLIRGRRISARPDLVGFARGMQERVPSLRHLIVARGRTDDKNA